MAQPQKKKHYKNKGKAKYQAAIKAHLDAKAMSTTKEPKHTKDRPYGAGDVGQFAKTMSKA